MSYVLTKDQVKEEIKKCGRDPVYFITNYCKISHPEKGLIPFSLYGYQQKTIKDFEDYRFNIVLKARQLGLSTAVAGYIAWMLLYRRQKSVLVVATKLDVAANLVKKVKKMIKSLPSWMNIADISIDNRNSFELNNGSWIKASSTSESAGRSEALSLLVIDEAAFVEGMEDLWKSIFPTLSTGGRCIAISTPNGVGNWFHETYTNAESNTNDFHAIKLNWDAHPERDRDWFEAATRNMNRRDIAQEYECHTAYTKIITPFGFKYIKDIQIGDQVLTHRGHFRKVTRLYNKQTNKENLVSISTPMSRKNPIEITKEHPILTAVRATTDSFNIFNEIRENIFDEKWLGAEEIMNKYGEYSVPQYAVALMPKLDNNIFQNKNTIFDLAALNIHKIFTNDIIRTHRQKGNNKRFIQLDEETGKMVGLYLAEGFSNKNEVVFSFNSEEKNLIDFVKYWSNKYGFTVREHIRNYAKCTTVHISGKFLPMFFKNFIDGNTCYNKTLNETIYQCSADFVRAIINGIWLGDGLHLPDKKNVLGLANPQLIYQIRMLMTAFNLFTRVSYVEQHSEGRNSKTRYYLELNNVNGRNIEECTKNGIPAIKGQKSKFAKNKWWGRPTINEYKSEDENVQVYNIEVEEDNSYVAENLIVHNCSFNASGEGVINSQDLQEIREGVLEPKYRTGFDRNYWIWEEARVDFTYLLVADVARGDGKDFSAFHVIKLETMEQVAEYQGKIAPDIYADMLFQTGKEYNNALLVVENNNIGYNVLDKLIERKYPNIYFSIKSTHEYIEQVQAESMNNSVPGFTTTQKTRPLIVAKLEEFIRNRLIKIYSNRTVEELSTFVWNNGRPEAMKNRNDDLTMSLAIACWVRDTALTVSQRDIEYTKAMFNAITVANTRVQTKIPGQIGYNGNYSMDEKRVNQKELKEFYKMYDWLYKG